MDDDRIAKDTDIGLISGHTQDLSEPAVKLSHARLSRKRTKTGCLTCRRRRIKCGEERPTCGNCIKSKRQCEGYNQRVIFKDPLGPYRAPASATQANSSFSTENVISLPSGSQYTQFRSEPSPPQPSQPAIAPKTNGSFHEHVSTDTATLPGPSEYSDQSTDRRVYDISPESGVGHGTMIHHSSSSVPSVGAHCDTIEPSYLPNAQESSDQPIPYQPETHYDLNNLFKRESKSSATQSLSSLHPDHSNGPNCASDLSIQELVYQSDTREAASALFYQPYHGSANLPLYLAAQHNPSHAKLVSDIQPHTTPVIATDQQVPPELFPTSENRSSQEEFEEMKQSHENNPPYSKHRPALRDRAMHNEMPFIFEERKGMVFQDVEKEVLAVGVLPGDCFYLKPILPDDELFDVSDEEMNPEEYDHDPEASFGKAQQDHLKNNDLGIVVALQASQDRQDQRLRTYHAFLDGYGPDVLAAYQPSARNSPLSDSTTARIFCHYVNVTGPSISLYERHPANPSLMFQGRPVPKSRQHIWTYTMPTLALNNQALLHAMLAIGSLHMALLQDGPITASLKHYHIALRRVAKSVRLPMRRGQPATLAATLMLGWYELMSADHQKWSNHLLGAKQLLKEIDFAGMTRYLKKRKLQQRQARHSNLYHHDMAFGRIESRYNEQAQNMETLHDDDVNENLVSMIMGKKLRYDEYGQVLEDVSGAGSHYKTYTQRELEIYENQRDLFWWYCKQDAFQSILSGNRLFMQYDLWSHCPPRAAIGRRDATYGTFDHLILLLGRLAEFAAKDLKRKRKAMHSNGGQWRPSFGASSQSFPTGQNPSPPSGPPQIPSFAGMMPGTEGKATLPRGFSPTREESPASEDDECSLQDWTIAAEEEWQEIRAAFSIIQENFGPDFQPLGPEHSQPIQTPFGPALQFRTYGIGGIWIIYYMGLILCHRYHPSMPPAATIAAGIAARQTASYANEIGRIAAAIAPNASEMPQVSTQVGAGLIEITFGLFIAAVQYQDSMQRSWLVQRCFDIKRLTGWQTADAIAMGCESAWAKAAEAGRGPPYTRLTEKKEDRVIWHTAKRRVDNVLSERNTSDKLVVAKTEKVHYALGLLGVEEDFYNLDFENDDNGRG